MTNDEQYVPSEEQVRVAYMGDRITYDGLSGEEALGEWAAFLARVRRDAWQEGYDQGAEDGITSEQMQVGIGLGGIARPARTNPYEETP